MTNELLKMPILRKKKKCCTFTHLHSFRLQNVIVELVNVFQFFFLTENATERER